jgi:hypothetical protein
MRIGLNGGGTTSVDADLVSTWGPMTTRAGVNDVAAATEILRVCDQALPRPVKVLFLVQSVDPGLVHDLGVLLAGRADVGVELGNELNLHGVEPSDFGAFVMESYVKLRDGLNYIGEIWGGAPSDCRRNNGLDYLETAGVLSWPSDLGCALHRYPADPWTQDPTPGQEIEPRWREQAHVIALLANRPIAVTEFGFHYEVQTKGWGEFRRHTQLSEDRGAAYLAADLTWFSQMNVQLATMYQWTDGAPENFNQAIDRFGIRRSDGTFRERIIDVLTDWAAR